MSNIKLWDYALLIWLSNSDCLATSVDKDKDRAVRIFGFNDLSPWVLTANTTL